VKHTKDRWWVLRRDGKKLIVDGPILPSPDERMVVVPERRALAAERKVRELKDLLAKTVYAPRDKEKNIIQAIDADTAGLADQW
jgi:hypothetical protein